MCLNLGLCGQIGVGVDIGGFFDSPSPGIWEFPLTLSELFARWMELGSLLPFCRVHSAINTPNQEPWSFGEEAERISRKFLELRYQLLPYIYTWTR